MWETFDTSSEKQIPKSDWHTNKSRFPALAEVALAYLSAPCTSVDSEHAHVLDEKRIGLCVLARIWRYDTYHDTGVAIRYISIL